MNGPIVVGTDGSPSAERAVSAAIAMARRSGQPLHIVQAYLPRPVTSTSSFSAPFVVHTMDSRALRPVPVSDGSQRARRAGVQATDHPRIGTSVDAVLMVAKEVDASVIVVGNRGAQSWTRFLVGSVAGRLVRLAPCEVHVVNTCTRVR